MRLRQLPRALSLDVVAHNVFAGQGKKADAAAHAAVLHRDGVRKVGVVGGGAPRLRVAGRQLLAKLLLLPLVALHQGRQRGGGSGAAMYGRAQGYGCGVAISPGLA